MLWQPLSLGLTAMMLAMPAYAEKENTAVPATPETAASTVAASEVAPAVENAAPVGQKEVVPVAEAKAAPAEQAAPEKQAPAQKAENKLAPYIGKTITKQIIKGNKVVPEADIAAVLKTKPGMAFSEAGLTEDLSAIYELGYFYDLRPEFKVVPEGVQVIYNVMENPVYKRTEIVGSTVLNKKNAEALFTMDTDKIANLREINTSVQKLEEEYRSNGYIFGSCN